MTCFCNFNLRNHSYFRTRPYLRSHREVKFTSTLVIQHSIYLACMIANYKGWAILDNSGAWNDYNDTKAWGHCIIRKTCTCGSVHHTYPIKDSAVDQSIWEWSKVPGVIRRLPVVSFKPDIASGNLSMKVNGLVMLCTCTRTCVANDLYVVISFSVAVAV